MVFKLTWFDEMAASDRPYKLFFFPVDNSIEIVDVKSGKIHLRRIRNFDVERSQLIVGNQLTIYGRRYKIVEYGDQQTKNINSVSKEKAFVLIKPDAYLNMGKMINDITSLGLFIVRAHMMRLTDPDVQFLYAEHLGRPYFKQLASHMLSDVVVGIEIAGDQAL